MKWKVLALINLVWSFGYAAEGGECEKIYTLITADGQKVSVSEHILKQSSVLSNMLEDLGETDENGNPISEIPVQAFNITAETLNNLIMLENETTEEKIIEFFDQQDEKKIKIDEKVLDEKVLYENLLNRLSIREYINLILAIDILDYKFGQKDYGNFDEFVKNYNKKNLIQRFYDYFIPKMRTNTLTQKDEISLENIDRDINLRKLLFNNGVILVQKGTSVSWSPSGDSYFVIFKDHKGVLYTKAGQLVEGSQLEEFNYIDWSPSGNNYFVKFRDNKGVLYSKAGQLVEGSQLEKVDYISWSSSGDSYFVKFRDNKGGLYSKEGQLVEGSQLEGVVRISWSPSGDYYFVKFSDNKGGLYSKEGQLVEGSQLEKVDYIYWSPSGDSYFVNFSDNKGGLYSKAGQLVEGSQLGEFNYIDWSPSGDYYFVKFRDNKGGLYSKEGQLVEGSQLEKVVSIYWSPSGDNYFVKFENWDGVLYSKAGQLVERSQLEKVDYISWSPSGDSYFVINFKDDKGVLYTKEGKLVRGSGVWRVKDTTFSFSLSQKSVYWSPSGDSYFVSFKDDKGVLYTKEGKLVKGSQLEGVDYIDWSPSGDNYFVKFKNWDGLLYNKAGQLVGGSRLEKVENIDWSPSGNNYFVKFKYDQNQLCMINHYKDTDPIRFKDMLFESVNPVGFKLNELLQAKNIEIDLLLEEERENLENVIRLKQDTRTIILMIQQRLKNEVWQGMSAIIQSGSLKEAFDNKCSFSNNREKIKEQHRTELDSGSDEEVDPRDKRKDTKNRD